MIVDPQEPDGGGTFLYYEEGACGVLLTLKVYAEACLTHCTPSGQ